MRTNIDIDDTLLAEAMSEAGHSTKKATVEEALKMLILLKRQRKAFEEMRGMGWEGNLEKMRQDWSPRIEE